MDNNAWNREELYKEVWDEPLVKLAERYGISAVALGKVCRKLKIPLPGTGYWIKKEFGKAPEQTPLPEFKDAPVVRRVNTTPNSTPAIDSSDPELAQIAAVEATTIPLSGEQHKLVASSAGLLRRARTNQYGLIEPPSDKPCLDVRVSKELLDRALVLMSSILFALVANGFESHHRTRRNVREDFRRGREIQS